MTGDIDRRVLATTRFWTSEEAAAYLRLERSTLEAMRVDGTGPRYFKVGPGRRAKVLYTQEDIDSWLAKYRYQSTSEYGRGE